MLRWAMRIVGGLLLLALMVSVPILWVEGICATSPSASAPASRAPSWTIADTCGVNPTATCRFPSGTSSTPTRIWPACCGRAIPSDFAYGRQIVGFWSNLCTLTRVVTAREKVATDTKVMLYTIGWSFTTELALKGIYENTIGRLFEWLRGERPDGGRHLRRARHAGLRGVPAADALVPVPVRLPAGRLLAQHAVARRASPRKLERRLSVTLEYATKAAYGAVIGYASTATLGASDLDIYTVFVGLDGSDQAREPQIRVVRELGGGRTLVRTPRYQAYSDLVVRLARRGRNVAEIAGNRRILITVLAPVGPQPPLPGTSELFEVAIQSRPDRRRLGLDVSVEQLGATIRALEAAGRHDRAHLRLLRRDDHADRRGLPADRDRQ